MRKISLILTGLAALAIFGCADKVAKKNADIQKELLSDKSIPVSFVTPSLETIENQLEVSGPFATLDQVQVGARIPGRLSYVAVQDGTQVRAGQVIAQVDTTNAMIQVQQAMAGVAAARAARDQAVTQSAMSPMQSLSVIRQAEAQLKSAKARLSMVRQGARTQEKEQVKERVNATKSALDKAKTDLERAKNLFKQDAIAKMEVDAAQLQYDTALANYRSAVEAYSLIIEGSRPEEITQAEESVRQAEEALRVAKTNQMVDSVRRQQVQQANAALQQAEAQLRLARQQMSDASIISPIDGFVSGTPAKTGQVVSAGNPVATIVGLNGVYLEGQIPENEISKIKVGQSATVTLDAYPNESFVGTVVALRPTAANLGRLFAARIAVSNSGGKLKPGMFGKATIVVGTLRDVVLIPTDAILRDGEKDFVYVANGNKAKKIEIKLGVIKGEKTQVIGLSPSERVVLKGKDLVTEGGLIREDKEAGGGKK